MTKKKTRILTLVPKGDIPDVGIIQQLEQLLKEAKRGEIQGFAYFSSTKDDCFDFGFLGDKFHDNPANFEFGYRLLRRMYDMEVIDNIVDAVVTDVFTDPDFQDCNSEPDDDLD